jgi:hypothetical protein
MSHCLGMEYEEIGKSFEGWNKSGPLVSVSAAVCHASLTRIQYDNLCQLALISAERKIQRLEATYWQLQETKSFRI